MGEGGADGLEDWQVIIEAMRNLFPEYYTPTKEEFEELWKNCIFVLDTNVLLNLYWYSEESREDFFQMLEKESIGEHLWLPYHAASEFQKNRIAKFEELKKEQKELTVKVEKALEEKIKTIEDRAKGKLPRDRLAPYAGKLLKIFKESLQNLKEAKTEREEIQNYQNDDKVRERIDKLFSGKIGASHSEEKSAQLYKEAQERYSNEVPPGYKDNNKKANKYGDFIIWSDALEEAKKREKALIFVTNNTKEDWFDRVNSERAGPRLELLKEMRDKTSKFGYIYSFDSFYKFAKEYLNQDVSKESLDEIEALEERQRELERRKAYKRDVKKAIASPDSTLLDQNISKLLEIENEDVQKFVLGNYLSTLYEGTFYGSQAVFPMRNLLDSYSRGNLTDSELASEIDKVFFRNFHNLQKSIRHEVIQQFLKVNFGV